MNLDNDNPDQDLEKQPEYLCGVYCLQGVTGKSAVKITPLGTVSLTENEHIRDTRLKILELGDQVQAHVMACNISHVAITSSKKQPVLTILVIKQRPIQSILLFRLSLMFVNETEVKTAEEFLKKKLYGKFVLELEIDGLTQELLFDMPTYDGNDKIIDRIEEFLKNPEMLELISSLVVIEEERSRKQMEEKLGAGMWDCADRFYK